MPHRIVAPFKKVIGKERYRRSAKKFKERLVARDFEKKVKRTFSAGHEVAG